MRSNSGSGKSNNNLRDPTMKENELTRKKIGHPPAQGRDEDAADQRTLTESGPVD